MSFRFLSHMLTLAIVTTLMAAPVHATIQYDAVDPVNILEGGGLSAEDMIIAATQMPAVQLALQEMAGFGYVRVSGADQAQHNAATHTTVVCLAFTDPGNATYAPVVVVGSRPFGSTIHTVVIGGVAEVDPLTHAISFPAGQPELNGFVVEIGSMGSADPSNYAATRTPGQRFREWLACSIIGGGASALTCATTGVMAGPWAPPVAAACTFTLTAAISWFCI